MPELPRYRIVLIGDARRRSRELRCSAATVLAAVLGVLVALPTLAGVVLGASQQQALLRSAHRLARLPHAPESAPGSRRVAYRLAPVSHAPPPPPPRDAVPAVPVAVDDADALVARPLETPEALRGHLRIYALHHDEYVDVVPFDAQGRRDEAAFAALAHLFRCRITGHEVEIDEGLVRLLTAINDLYDRPLHLVSGHRVANTIHTSPTSQHTMGTAADVRVPGVSVMELREVARQLGARGLGLYRHQRFVHIDFRDKRPYYWTDGSEDDGRLAEGGAQHAHHVRDGARATATEAVSDDADTGAPEVRAAESADAERSTEPAKDGHVSVAQVTRYEG